MKSYIITLQSEEQPYITLDVTAEGIATVIVKVSSLISALHACTGDEYEIAEVKLYE